MLEGRVGRGSLEEEETEGEITVEGTVAEGAVTEVLLIDGERVRVDVRTDKLELIKIV